jgi:hypothetical protein
MKWKVSSDAKVEEFNDKLVACLEKLGLLASRAWSPPVKKAFVQAVEAVSELNDLWVEVVVLDEETNLTSRKEEHST